jgi:myo-inositol-1(or 4)-monophosphatase
LPGDDIIQADLTGNVVAAVREAGALALKTFRGQVRSWIKGKSSPVSEADLAVDALLHERLLTIRDCGWLSEETEDDAARLQKSQVWVVDPIDGTRAYLSGLPDWSISVALVSDGRPVIGALYAPVTDECPLPERALRSMLLASTQAPAATLRAQLFQEPSAGLTLLPQSSRGS